MVGRGAGTAGRCPQGFLVILVHDDLAPNAAEPWVARATARQGYRPTRIVVG